MCSFLLSSAHFRLLWKCSLAFPASTLVTDFSRLLKLIMVNCTLSMCLKPMQENYWGSCLFTGLSFSFRGGCIQDRLQVDLFGMLARTSSLHARMIGGLVFSWSVTSCLNLYHKPQSWAVSSGVGLLTLTCSWLSRVLCSFTRTSQTESSAILSSFFSFLSEHSSTCTLQTNTISKWAGWHHRTGNSSHILSKSRGTIFPQCVLACFSLMFTVTCWTIAEWVIQMKNQSVVSTLLSIPHAMRKTLGSEFWSLSVVLSCGSFAFSGAKKLLLSMQPGHSGRTRSSLDGQNRRLL